MLGLTIAGPSLAQAGCQIAMISDSEVFCALKAFYLCRMHEAGLLLYPF
jgi:hypothetical protein